MHFVNLCVCVCLSSPERMTQNKMKQYWIVFNLDIQALSYHPPVTPLDNLSGRPHWCSVEGVCFLCQTVQRVLRSLLLQRGISHVKRKIKGRETEKSDQRILHVEKILYAAVQQSWNGLSKNDLWRSTEGDSECSGQSSPVTAGWPGCVTLAVWVWPLRSLSQTSLLTIRVFYVVNNM